ncbi:MAG: urate hydroxylase PuuD [Alphaproteobacteria bacterium]
MVELSYEYPLFWEWLSFVLRWLHVITAIAWVGSSFYFIALDLGLQHKDHLPKGVHGEQWQVHGGGFYHIQKYLIAPPNMPEKLIWFKWESYMTLISGSFLMFVVYYAGAELLLIDPDIMPLSPNQAILISLLSLIIGFVLYDFICRLPLGKNNYYLSLFLFLMLILVSYAYSQLFSGRAAMLHIGAFTATIMTCNVFFTIIPNQKKVVAALKAGNKPDPKLGLQAKQRSTHNNYLVLGVIFLMLSNHYPLAFASPYNWVMAPLIFLSGAAVRYFFNQMHSDKGKPYWAFGIAAILFLAVMWLSSLNHPANASEFTENEIVSSIVENRCAMCHAQDPAWPGIIIAPRGVALDSIENIMRNTRQIYLQAGISNAMPPANITAMEPEERAIIKAWYEFQYFK